LSAWLLPRNKSLPTKVFRRSRGAGGGVEEQEEGWRSRRSGEEQEERGAWRWRCAAAGQALRDLNTKVIPRVHTGPPGGATQARHLFVTAPAPLS